MRNKIKVHEKALAHLSRGLYRSPASAIKELVSNAWDAGAKVVRINTNYPNFYQLSVEDNGDGFSKSQFEELMNGGIGNSKKRLKDEKGINDRPIIGRLGIGMLGIAQISGAFRITSKPKQGEGFCARVYLYDLLKRKLDIEDREVYGTKEIDVGEYEFIKGFNPDEVKYGTTIITDEVHPTFIQSFQDSLPKDENKRPPLDWCDAIGIVSKVWSLQELGDYWRLLWEMAAACPIPYINDNALPDRLVTSQNRVLKQYDFKVIIDGIELFKPVLLKDNPNGYTTKKIELQTQKIYGKDLCFHGYILVQEGKQLFPDELRGIMLRIKNISIGLYDPSMLDYRVNEGPRSRWITGEINVDQGLEDALNIDRDSFNKFHPEYRAIRAFIHEVLQKQVFPEVYKQIEIRSNKKEKARQNARTEYLKEVILDVPRSIKGESKPIPFKDTKVSIKQVIIKPDDDEIKTKKTHRHLASAILTIFDTALKEKSPDAQRNLFLELLLKLLSKW